MRTYCEGQTPLEQLAKPSQIMVATNLADCEFLLPHAIEQAKTCGASLTLVHSLVNAAGSPEVDVPTFADVERCAHEKMEAAVQQVKAEGVRCGSIISHTYYLEDTLPGAIRRIGAKRLIMGTHGRGRIGQIVLGSVAQKLLGLLDIPIFVVGPHVGASAGHCNPKKILHPVSFSHGYEESIEFARNIAELYGAELMLMHVLDPDLNDKIDPKRTVQWAKNALDQAISDRTTLTVPLLTYVGCGNIVDEILNTTEVFRADWIVLGANLPAQEPILMNSIAYKLMAAAKVPVLTLPRKVRPGAEKPEAVAAAVN